MTNIELDNLCEWANNFTRCRKYAETIVAAEKEMRESQRILNDNYSTWSPSEWLNYCTKVENMQRSVTMKVKHFFDMVYGKGNIFCQNLKGKDNVDHWFEFKRFAHNNYCNCEI